MSPSLLSRPALADDSPVDRARVMARTFATLYGSGATVVTLTLALPHSHDRSVIPMVVAVSIAYAVVAAMLVFRERTPHLVFQALPPLGTVLVTVVIVAGGDSSVPAYAMMYFWVVLAAFYFFGRGLAAANMVWVAVAYGAVLALGSGATRMIEWCMAVAALSVSGALIFKLRGRVDALIARVRRDAGRTERLAELQERAMAGADTSEIMEGAVDLVADCLHAEFVAILELLPGERELLVRWGRGWEAGVVGHTRVDLSEKTQAAFTLDSGRPVFTREDDGREHAFSEVPRRHGCREALTVAIPTHDGAYGLIAALSRQAGAFGGDDASLMRELALKLGTTLERRRHDEQMRRRAYFDQLTGQPNRTLFLERLEETLARAGAKGDSLAVFFLDLDDFKVVNDSLGHDAGDELLCTVAPRLRSALMVTDTVARFGGDEFIVLCEGLREDRAVEHMAASLLDALARPVSLRGAPYRMSASVGVAVSQPGDSAQDLVRNADTAMYAAKARARGEFEVFDAAMRDKVVARLSVENALAAAQERGELSLAYQPIVSLSSGRVHAVEALLRWDRGGHGPVSPAEFIPVAEHTGLIVPIGRWVLRQALADAAGWRRALGADLVVNVNLSPRQVGDPDLLEAITGALADTGFSPAALALEITEGVLLEDTDATLAHLEALRRIGAGLVLDDFGSGYSSLSYLRRLPLDTLKIDRSFVATMRRGGEEAAIVRAVADMGAALGLSVVAEGIETADQLDLVADLGCTSAQGYLIARPMPAAEMLDFLAADRHRRSAGALAS